jgi:hypothetical protein
MPQKAKQQRSTVVETRDISRISVMLRSKIETWIRLILFISKIKLLNDVIYNYFADNFGHNETVPDKSMVAKYKDYTVKELKKALQNLKSNKGDLNEIKYVSRTVRDKLRNNNNDGLTSDSIRQVQI